MYALDWEYDPVIVCLTSIHEAWVFRSLYKLNVVMWYSMPALGTLSQEDQKFEIILRYIVSQGHSPTHKTERERGGGEEGREGGVNGGMKGGRSLFSCWDVKCMQRQHLEMCWPPHSWVQFKPFQWEWDFQRGRTRLWRKKQVTQPVKNGIVGLAFGT